MAHKFSFSNSRAPGSRAPGRESLSARLDALDPRDSIVSALSISSSYAGSAIFPRREPPSYDVDSYPPSLVSSRNGETGRTTAAPPAPRQLYVDVAFLVDVTGSMQCWVNKVHEKLEEIINAIKAQHPTAVLRTGFVGYRDCDDAEPIVVKDFQNNPTELRNFVKGIVAIGGNDEAEDVLIGLDALLSLSWLSRYRHVIHIGDAPPHGRQFHGPHTGDSYPDGVPGAERPTIEEILLTMCQKRIQYNFLKLNDSTDEMVRAFNLILHKYQQKIRETTLKSSASEFVPAVVGSIASSLPPSYS